MGCPLRKFINKGLTDEAQAKHEISILKALGSHPNVVCLVDTFETPAAYAVLLEYVAGGEVFDKLADNGPFSEKDAAKIVRECAMALRHMHKLGIVHRDLKPENLLSQDTNDVKVADFGLAAFFGNGHEPLTQACGTITYLAPEMISAQQTGGSYGAGVDLWSLGAILFSSSARTPRSTRCATFPTTRSRSASRRAAGTSTRTPSSGSTCPRPPRARSARCSRRTPRSGRLPPSCSISRRG